jgi:hypothetical protein
MAPERAQSVTRKEARMRIMVLGGDGHLGRSTDSREAVR